MSKSQDPGKISEKEFMAVATRFFLGGVGKGTSYSIPGPFQKKGMTVVDRLKRAERLARDEYARYLETGRAPKAVREGVVYMRLFRLKSNRPIRPLSESQIARMKENARSILKIPVKKPIIFVHKPKRKPGR